MALTKCLLSHTPFGGPKWPPVGLTWARPMGSTTTMTPRGAALAAMFLALFSASAARHALPHVKEATRAPAVKKTAERVPTQAVAGASRTAARHPAKPAGPTAAVVVRVTPARFPRPKSVVRPKARAPGADALGVSVPKSHRWAVLGGHGRHGVG